MYKFIICLLEAEIGIDESILSPDAMIKNELLLSSLDYIKLITLLEEEYNIEFPDEALIMEDDLSVDEFCTLIFNMLRERENITDEFS